MKETFKGVFKDSTALVRWGVRAGVLVGAIAAYRVIPDNPVKNFIEDHIPSRNTPSRPAGAPGVQLGNVNFTSPHELVVTRDTVYDVTQIEETCDRGPGGKLKGHALHAMAGDTEIDVRLDRSIEQHRLKKDDKGNDVLEVRVPPPRTSEPHVVGKNFRYSNTTLGGIDLGCDDMKYPQAEHERLMKERPAYKAAQEDAQKEAKLQIERFIRPLLPDPYKPIKIEIIYDPELQPSPTATPTPRPRSDNGPIYFKQGDYLSVVTYTRPVYQARPVRRGQEKILV